MILRVSASICNRRCPIFVKGNFTLNDSPKRPSTDLDLTAIAYEEYDGIMVAYQKAASVSRRNTHEEVEFSASSRGNYKFTVTRVTNYLPNDPIQLYLGMRKYF